MHGILRSDTRLRTIEWSDLLALSPAEKFWELTLSLPWLAVSLGCYHAGWVWAGAFCSFYFFLTGLRQSHGAQHYALGLPRRVQDGVLFALSVLMLGSMHAVQISHLHHHRHCLDPDDTEGSTARLSWWRALLVGPLFPVRLHFAAWRLASAAKRRWIAAEVAAIVVLVAVVISGSTNEALRWHLGAMLLGESMTGFFAVWTVHHGCDPADLYARTQRGRWFTAFSYSMFFHAEHHLFPQVPTCRLAQLAGRLDAALPELSWPPVIRAVEPTPNVVKES
ncbi:MAG: fatty acid desaturase [Verrucomicrobiota bacterium]